MDVDGYHIMQIIKDRAGEHFHDVSYYKRTLKEDINENFLGVGAATFYFKKSFGMEDFIELMNFLIDDLKITIIHESILVAGKYYCFDINYRSILSYWERIK